MVRTKETAGGSKAGGKAPRKGLGGPSASSSPSSSAGAKKPRDEGGNPYCPRETPAWQKPITHFFKQSSQEDDEGDKNDSNAADVGTSSGCGDIDSSSKENIKPHENQDLTNSGSKDPIETKDNVVSEPKGNINDHGEESQCNTVGSSKEGSVDMLES